MYALTIFVKILSKFLRSIGKGGETWPGEIVLRFFPSLVSLARSHFKEVIYVVGTNGKTTTTAAIVQHLRLSKKNVITNSSGANQLNGVVSSIFRHYEGGKKDYYGVFEVDEFSLSNVSAALPPTRIVMLNVVRDQLDRYGEVRTILTLWEETLMKLPQVTIIANASDPGIEHLCKRAKVSNCEWFAIPKSLLLPSTFVAGDSVYCMLCGTKLHYEGIYVSHLGSWKCTSCNIAMPKSYTFPPSLETYLAQVPSYVYINLQPVYLLVNQLFSVEPRTVLQTWQPAFGRNETVEAHGRKYTFILGKNPASWSVAVADLFRKDSFASNDAILFGLNNRVPDGHDVSWIWDIEISQTKKTMPLLYAFGDRAYDMVVRLEVAGWNATVIEDVKKVQASRIFVVANYSALLEARKIITGRAIL